MKINYFAISILGITLLFTACKSDELEKTEVKEENNVSTEKIPNGRINMQMPDCKVLEIEENNTLLLELVENCRSYKVGDKIRVKYNRYEKDIDSPNGGSKAVTPQINDIVIIMFMVAGETGEDGIDLIISESVTVSNKYANTDSTYETTDDNATSDVNDDNSSDKNATQMKVIEGKVIEIEDENTILLEITKERGGYSIGDNVKVKFERYIEQNINLDEETNVEVSPAINDIVGVQFLKSESEDGDGIDLIIEDEVYKYVD